MAKQKSGLGRGLNALFDDSPTYTQKPSAPETLKEQERSVPEPLSEEPAQKKQESAGVLHQALQERTAKRSSGKPVDPSSDIYISEDALENAKVVSREARKPAMRAGSGTFSSAGSVSMRTPAPKPRVAAERQVRKPAKPVVEPALEVSKKENKPFDSKGLTATVKLDPTPISLAPISSQVKLRNLQGLSKKKAFFSLFWFVRLETSTRFWPASAAIEHARAWVWKKFPFVFGKPTTTKLLSLP